MTGTVMIAGLFLGSFALFVCCAKPHEAPQSPLTNASTQPVAPVEIDLPRAIADLKSQIKGKAPREVASIIVQRFGPPNRDVGSGLTILDWDVVGGDLRLTVQGGPPIFRISDGKKLWLVETENPAGDNIVSEFEMSTLPDPKNHGSRSWLGDLTLRANRKYEYTRPEYDSVPNNFFSDNPRGTYTATYSTGVSSITLLENIPDNSPFATIHFSGEMTPGTAGPVTSTDLQLCSSSQNHWLHFIPSGNIPLSYTLECAWHNCWGPSSQFEWDFSFPPPPLKP
jgi:hypothetical protein